MRIERELLSTFAHDLRQPLRSIMLGAQRLQRQGELQGECAAWVEEVLVAAQTQADLISSVVEYDHAIHSGLKGDALVPLHIALQTACLKLEPYRQQRAAKIRIPRENSAVTVPMGLSKVFGKVVHNGLKFQMKDASPEVNIEVGGPDGSWVEVRVLDNGIGIEPKYREAVFRPFAKLNPASDYAGSGLGLSISLRMMESIGGTMGVEGRSPGAGTIVVIRFPTEI